MVLQQRLRTEVSQAKRETNFYLSNVDKSAHMDKLKRKRQKDGQKVNQTALVDLNRWKPKSFLSWDDITDLYSLF